MSGLWLGPFLALGLLGAAHCAGMCGGFAIAVSSRPSGARARSATASDVLAFATGKATTYAVLGAAVALAATRLAASDARLHAWRETCAWIAGAVLVLHGLALVGLRLPRVRRSARVAALRGRVAKRLGPALAAVRALPGYAGPFGVGAFTGLVPCGLSWSAILLGAALTPERAAVGLFVFGLATTPALLGVALGWSALSARHRRLASTALGPLLVVFGALTILRGAHVGTGTLAASALPDCCAER